MNRNVSLPETPSIEDRTLPIGESDDYSSIGAETSSDRRDGEGDYKWYDYIANFFKSGDFGSFINKVWDDITGTSQIKLQNELEMQRMQKQFENDLEAKLKSYQYEAEALSSAGLNRNLMYSGGAGSTPTSQAPTLQAVTGNQRIDTILSRVGAVLKFLPAMYQASAGAEMVEQERIKTASDWLGLRQKEAKTAEEIDKRPFLARVWSKKGMRDYKLGVVGAGNEYESYQQQITNAYLSGLEGAINKTQLSRKSLDLIDKRIALSGLDYYGRAARNMYDYGITPTGTYQPSMVPYYQTRNQQAYLNYDIDQSWKQIGKASGIFAPYVQMLMGLISKGRYR